MSTKRHSARMLDRRKKHVRKKISGTEERPRLSVRRSLNHIYAQIIDDTKGHTLVEASTVSLKLSSKNSDAAKAVGKAVAERAKEKSISAVQFDRGGRLYHGRLKAVADAAREAGLKF